MLQDAFVEWLWCCAQFMSLLVLLGLTADTHQKGVRTLRNATSWKMPSRARSKIGRASQHARLDKVRKKVHEDRKQAWTQRKADGGEMRVAAEREASIYQAFFQKVHKRLWAANLGKYFGVQSGIRSGGMILIADTRAEVLAALQPDRPYLQGYFQPELEREAYRSVVVEAFEAVLSSDEAFAFYRAFADQAHGGTERKRRGIARALTDAFLLQHVSSELEGDRSSIAGGTLSERRRKRMRNALARMSVYGFGSVPLLHSQTAVTQWILRALRAYAKYCAADPLGRCDSLEGLEDYRLGLG